jgi:hypothetical protein
MRHLLILVTVPVVAMQRMKWTLLITCFMFDHRSIDYVRESAAAMDRQALQRAEEVWLCSDLYPPYYTSFHYQTDGWLSSRWDTSLYRVGAQAHGYRRCLTICPASNTKLCF